MGKSIKMRHLYENFKIRVKTNFLSYVIGRIWNLKYPVEL